jgi:hypothetical protein
MSTKRVGSRARVTTAARSEEAEWGPPLSRVGSPLRLVLPEWRGEDLNLGPSGYETADRCGSSNWIWWTDSVHPIGPSAREDGLLPATTRQSSRYMKGRIREIFVRPHAPSGNLRLLFLKELRGT